LSLLLPQPKILMEGNLSKQRLHYLDVMRGIAIILMMIYHFSFDLDHFDFIQVEMNSNLLWRCFRYTIISLFLFTMGISLALTHAKRICWPCIKKRTLLLGIFSILVSIASYTQFPQSWIYFGILHFILVASWLGLLFIGRPWLAFITAIIILVGFYLGWLHSHALFALLQRPLHLPIGYTEDVVRVFPWFSLVLLGIFFVGKQWHLSSKLRFTPSKLSHKISFLGRHSLLIYLIHQPILFGLTRLASKLS